MGLGVPAPDRCLLIPERNRDGTLPFSQAETFSTNTSLRLGCCLNSKWFLNTGKPEARQKDTHHPIGAGLGALVGTQGGHSSSCPCPTRCPGGSVSPLKPFILRDGGNSKRPWLFGTFWWGFFSCFKGSNKSGSSFASVNAIWSQGAVLEPERAWHSPWGCRMEEKVPGAEP